jgi:hypothetical protein
MFFNIFDTGVFMQRPILAWVVPVQLEPGQPDQGLPGYGRPDQGLPGRDWRPTDPGYGRPGYGGHPDQGLPGSGGYPSHGLPGQGGRPDQGLPGGGHPWFPGHLGGGNYPSQGPIIGTPEHPIVIPPNAVGPGAPSQPIYLPGKPEHGLPPFPSQGLPGGGGRPDQGLPGEQPQPGHPIVLPPGLPDQGLPPTPGLPPLGSGQPIVGFPDQGLPPTPPIPGYPSHQPLPPEHGGLPKGSTLLIPLPTDKPLPLPPGVPAGAKPVIAWQGPGTLPVVVWLPPQATPK